MSGGSMDYAFTHIYSAAEQVEQYRREMRDKDLEDFKFDADRMQITPEVLKSRVVAAFNEAVRALKIAEVYARRVEWLTSDDDGYDSFLKRIDEDLAKALSEQEEQ